MAILFVASEAFELKPFAARLSGTRALKWPLDYAEEGVWEGKRYLLAANGAGPKLSAQCVEVALRATSMAELSSSKLEAVVSVGVCGALQPSLPEGEIVLGSNVLAVDSGESFPCHPVTCHHAPRNGPIASLDRVLSAKDKQSLAETGAIAVEMESAGVARRAQTANLPFCCVKVVSDRADEDFVIDFNLMRTSEGRFSRGKIISYALKHPAVVPHLFSVKRRAEKAGGVLGVFLASCRFQFNDSSVEQLENQQI
jgi:adenosylhomocysteine nucleosidase